METKRICTYFPLIFLVACNSDPEKKDLRGGFSPRGNDFDDYNDSDDYLVFNKDLLKSGMICIEATQGLLKGKNESKKVDFTESNTFLVNPSIKSFRVYPSSENGNEKS
ncbi:MAG: hypothetical protein LBD32_01550 [Cytophagales bacterium]|jgi:hypothetical protein|nr:hypothetical protein [Cytophagales bacterium]